MTQKLYRVADVCDLAQLPPYVLRSWEKEFPGIGLQKTDDSARLYRQSDVDQVLRIKQLVFGEGLTLAGARRRLDQLAPLATAASEAAEIIEVLGADARKRIGKVREGLKSLLQMLDGASHAYRLAASGTTPATSPAPQAGGRGRAVARAVAQRGKSPSRSAKLVTSRGKSAAAARGKPAGKRKRASA